MSLSQRACLALIVCVPALFWAQQKPSPAASEGQSEVASPSASQSATATPAPGIAEGRIHLDVVVTDKSGKPVPGLELKDFTLLDNNQPAKILSFRPVDQTAHKARPPVEVILVIDALNETHQQVAFVRQEAAKFLSQNNGHLAQPVSLFVLTGDGLDAQRLPSVDGNALAAKVDQIDNMLRSVDRIGTLGGANDLFQRSVKTMTDIADAEAKKPDRKLLIWAGNGWPLLDSPRIQTTYQGQQQIFSVIVQLSTRLREARTSVYSISAGMPALGSYLYKQYLNGVKKDLNASAPNLGLKVLAVQTGGAVFSPDNDMTAQINRCVQDAQAFYTLSFDPPRADHANEYHDLKVLVGQPGLAARTNTGYYNQP
ncbi:MAG: VWA domain-containing protein [Terracidiphilus sp.]|jgi:VWFA-related protein